MNVQDKIARICEKIAKEPNSALAVVRVIAGELGDIAAQYATARALGKPAEFSMVEFDRLLNALGTGENEICLAALHAEPKDAKSAYLRQARAVETLRIKAAELGEHVARIGAAIPAFRAVLDKQKTEYGLFDERSDYYSPEFEKEIEAAWTHLCNLHRDAARAVNDAEKRIENAEFGAVAAVDPAD